jgi:hypothetical protein
MLFRRVSTGLSTGLSGEYLGCLSTLRTQRTQRTHGDADASWPLCWSFANAISIKLVISVVAVRMPYAMPYSAVLAKKPGLCVGPIGIPPSPA